MTRRCDAVALTGRGFYFACHRSPHTSGPHYDVYMDADWVMSQALDAASLERAERGQSPEPAVTVHFRCPPGPREEGALW